MKSLIYLSSPYTSVDPQIELIRVTETTIIVKRLFRAGLHVISPIIHCHPVRWIYDSYGEARPFQGDWEFWKEYNQNLISHCDEFYILNMDGSRNSKGMLAELDIAIELKKPIAYIRRASIEQGFVVEPFNVTAFFNKHEIS